MLLALCCSRITLISNGEQYLMATNAALSYGVKRGLRPGMVQESNFSSPAKKNNPFCELYIPLAPEELPLRKC
jgi:hypothetical protein